MFFAMIYKIKLINRILKRDSLFHFEFISESSSHLHEAQCRVSFFNLYNAETTEKTVIQRMHGSRQFFQGGRGLTVI